MSLKKYNVILQKILLGKNVDDAKIYDFIGNSKAKVKVSFKNIDKHLSELQIKLKKIWN